MCLISAKCSLGALRAYLYASAELLEDSEFGFKAVQRSDAFGVFFLSGTAKLSASSRWFCRFLRHGCRACLSEPSVLLPQKHF